MERYRVFYYTAADATCPFQSFLDGTTDKVRAKFFKLLTLLEEIGPNLKRPYADSLRDGIRELRVILSGGQYRGLYFFTDGRKIIVTHGIVKKTDKVPKSEIERALKYRSDYEERARHGKIEEGPAREFQRAQEEGS